MLMNIVREQLLNFAPSLDEFLTLFPSSLGTVPKSSDIKREIEKWEKSRWKQYRRNIKRIPTRVQFRSLQHFMEWVYSQVGVSAHIQSYLYSLNTPFKKKFIPVIHRIDKKLGWEPNNLRVGVNHNSADQRKYLKTDPKKSKLPETRQVFVIPLLKEKQGMRLDYSKMVFCANTSKAQELLKISHKNYIADKLHESENQCPEATPFCVYKNFLIVQKTPAPTLF